MSYTCDQTSGAERLGPRRVEAARRVLLDAVAELGGETAIRGRRVRPPS